jgi:hypothetical protein
MTAVLLRAIIHADGPMLEMPEISRFDRRTSLAIVLLSADSITVTDEKILRADNVRLVVIECSYIYALKVQRS